jgi:hypothetical protein
MHIQLCRKMWEWYLSKSHWIMIRVCNLGNVQRGLRPSLFRTNQLIDLFKLYAVCVYVSTPAYICLVCLVCPCILNCQGVY